MENIILKKSLDFQFNPLEAPTAPHQGSAEETFLRFSTAGAAAKYAHALEGTARHRREVACIRRGLEQVPAGAEVLDLPCGTGRLVPFLSSQGYRVTAADASPHMARLAHERFPDACHTFVTNVFATMFPDNAFDAVVCNRLFHHFRESGTRRTALRELHRICRPGGTLVVSFFCNSALDSWRFHVKDALRVHKATDRIPIDYSLFAGEIAAEGWEIMDRIPARPWLSPQWYLSLRKAL